MMIRILSNILYPLRVLATWLLSVTLYVFINLVIVLLMKKEKDKDKV